MRGRAAFVLGAFVVLDVWAQNAVPTPPPTRRDDVREVMHGVEIVDPYRWLEDGKSPETRAWIDAQNAYTQAVVGARPGRAVIRERIAGLARFDTQSVPPRRGRRYFLSRRRASDDLPIQYVREGLSGADEVWPARRAPLRHEGRPRRRPAHGQDRGRHRVAGGVPGG